MAKRDFEVFKATIEISLSDIRTTLLQIRNIQSELLDTIKGINVGLGNLGKNAKAANTAQASSAKEAADQTKKQQKSTEDAAKAEADRLEQIRSFDKLLRQSRNVTGFTDLKQDKGTITALRGSFDSLKASVKAVGDENQSVFSKALNIWNSTQGVLGTIKRAQSDYNFALAETSQQYGTVGKAALGIRSALFGLQGAGNDASKSLRLVDSALQFVINRTVSVNKAVDEFASRAANTAQTAGQFNRALADSLLRLRDAAKTAGIDGASSLGRLSSAANEASNRFDEIRTTVAAGGKVNKALLSAQTKSVQQLSNAFQNLESQGVIPSQAAINSLIKDLEKLEDQESDQAKELKEQIRQYQALRKQFDELRKSININSNAVREIGVALDASETKGTRAISKLRSGISNFVKGLRGGNDAAKGMSSAFLQSSSGLNQFDKQANIATKTIQKLTAGTYSFQKAVLATFTANVLFAGFQAIGRGFSGLLSNIRGFVSGMQREFFEANILVQNFEVTLKQMLTGFDEQTVTNALVGAQELIRDVIAKTPFELASGQQAFQQLITGGLDPREWLEPAADAAAAFNKPMQQLVFAIQRLKAGSKGIGVDMLRDFGIPVQQVGVYVEETSGRVLELDEVAGKTREELLASGAAFKQWAFDAQGSLEQTPTEAIDILNGFLNQNATIAGASAARSRTLTGVFSNMKDTITKLYTALGQPVFEQVTNAATALLEIVGEIMIVLEPFAAIIGERLAQGFKTLFENLTGINITLTEFGEFTEEARKQIEAIAEKILSVLQPALNVILALIEGDFERAWGLFLNLAKNTIQQLFRFLDTTGRSAFQWGLQFIGEISKGIISAASTLLTGAVSFIGNTISNFLKPGSPPKEGPLSDIDTWGATLIKTFTSSFRLPDFEFLNRITEPIKSRLLSLGKASQYSKIRKGVQSIITQINETGEINEKIWQRVEKQLGNASQATRELIRANLELKAVEKEVADAEEAGFIPKELQDKLEAAKLQVATKEEELAVEQELEQQRKQQAQGGTGAQASTNDFKKSFEEEKKILEEKKKLGLLTQDEFNQALESLNKQAADAAIRAGDEAFAKSRIADARSLAKAIAKAAEKAQIEQLKKQIEQEKKLLKLKFDAGLITEEEYRKGLIGIQERYLDSAFALGLPVDKEIEKLKSLQKELGDLTKIPLDDPAKLLASFAEEVTGEFDTLIESIQENFANAATTTWEDLKTTFFEEFDPVWEEIKKSISESLGGVFGGLTGDGGTAGFFSGVLSAIRDAIDQQWSGPDGIRANLEDRILETWEFLGSPDGPLARIDSALNTLLNSTRGWVADHRTDLEAFGGQLAGILIDGVKLVFTGATADKSGAALIWSSIIDGLKNTVNVFNQVGIEIIRGFISAIFGEGVGNAIANTTDAVLTFMTEFIATLLTPFDSLQRAADIVSRIFSDVYNIYLYYIGEKGLISGLISGFKEIIIGIFESIYNILVGESIVPDLVNEILGWITTLTTSFTEKIKTLKENVLGFFTDIKDGINSTITKVSEFGSTLAESAGSTGSSIADYLSGLLGTGFAEGTLSVPRTGPAIVHQGEAIIPANLAGIFRSLIQVASNLRGVNGNFNSRVGQSVERSSQRSIQINNPSFPNIQDGRDANDFLGNLDRIIRLSELRGSTV